MSEKFNLLEAANELNKKASETLWEVNNALLRQLKKEAERNDYLEKKMKNEEKFIKVDRSDFKALEKRLEEAAAERDELIEMLEIKHDSLESTKPSPGTETPDPDNDPIVRT